MKSSKHFNLPENKSDQNTNLFAEGFVLPDRFNEALGGSKGKKPIEKTEENLAFG